MVLVLGEEADRFVVCAVDGACDSAGVVEQLAETAGVSPDRLVLLPGGADLRDWQMAPLTAAIHVALAQCEPAEVKVGCSSAWDLLRPSSVASLLAGRRLERSRRQLSLRAPDERLLELARSLNEGAQPPGGPWRDRLVDARVHTVSVWAPGADGPRALLAMSGGGDAFDDRGGRKWATAGARGHAMRLLRGRKNLEATAIFVARTSPDTRPLGATGRATSSRDADEARHRAEQAGVGLARVIETSLAACVSVDPQTCRMQHFTAALAEAAVQEGAEPLPTDPAQEADGATPLTVRVLTLGDLRVVGVPGKVSDALRLELWPEEAAPVVVGPVGGDAGRFQTGREANQTGDDAEPSPWGPLQGRWLRKAMVHLQAPVEPFSVVALAGVEPMSSEPLPEDPSPHLSVVARLGRGDGQEGRQLMVDARWRLVEPSKLAPPGEHWQVRLEWSRPKQGWVPAMLRGLPVDDVHQGMRSKRCTGPGGEELRLRWSVAEPRRWKGRELRLRVGPALGGPLVSASVKVS